MDRYIEELGEIITQVFEDDGRWTSVIDGEVTSTGTWTATTTEITIEISGASNPATVPYTLEENQLIFPAEFDITEDGADDTIVQIWTKQ
jgi:hypothetical protein